MATAWWFFVRAARQGVLPWVSETMFQSIYMYFKWDKSGQKYWVDDRTLTLGVLQVDACPGFHEQGGDADRGFVVAAQGTFVERGAATAREKGTGGHRGTFVGHRGIFVGWRVEKRVE